MSRTQTVTIPQGMAARLQESTLGAYRILTQLARGGTATIYLAEHVVTLERVAVKVLDPSLARRTELIEQFLAELHIAEAAVHPGIVTIIGSHFAANGVPYLVMELLEGENLARLVDRDRVAIDAVMSVCAQVAAAASALHRAGYIHCDLKPDNVFVLYDELVAGWPKIKVIDYGVSRRIDGPGTEDGTISGTPAYMPPEQWLGEPTPKSDVYALGCMLHELLTGEQPFHGSLPQLMIQHAEHLPTRPSLLRGEVAPALDTLIMRMLAKDPAMRPTMAEVEAAVAKLSTAQPAPRAVPNAIAS